MVMSTHTNICSPKATTFSRPLVPLRSLYLFSYYYPWSFKFLETPNPQPFYPRCSYDSIHEPPVLEAGHGRWVFLLCNADVLMWTCACTVKHFLKSQYFYYCGAALIFPFFSFYQKHIFLSCLSTKLSKALLLNNKLTARFKLCEQHLSTAESEGVWMGPSAARHIQFRFETRQHRIASSASCILGRKWLTDGTFTYSSELSRWCLWWSTPHIPLSNSRKKIITEDLGGIDQVLLTLGESLCNLFH
jgi:hypothetical protein